MNLAIVVGNLGADPQVRSVASTGGTVANFNVATSERWRDSEGNTQERTEWHRIECWGRQAEIAEKYLSKGDLVSIQGSLRTDKWTDNEGVERYTTKIRCFRFNMHGKRTKSGERKDHGLRTPETNSAGFATDKTDDDYDDLPF